MILRLTNPELRLIEEALVEYSNSLREKARPLCVGYSAEGIALSCRRLEAEFLAEDVGKRGRLLRVESAARPMPRPELTTHEHPERAA